MFVAAALEQRAVAMAAIASNGWRMVVSGGATQSQMLRSSKPTTLMSCVTRRPPARSASYTPKACWSLPAKIAVGGSSSSSNSSAAAARHGAC